MQTGFWIWIDDEVDVDVPSPYKRVQYKYAQTYWVRPDGTRLCYFCKRPLANHAHCKVCSALIHAPHAKVPDVVRTRRRLYDKRLCESCHVKHNPQRLMDDIADFVGFATTLGQIDEPELPFR